MSSFTIKQTTVNQLPQTLLNKQDIGDYATNDSIDDKLQLNLLNYTTNRILEIPQNVKYAFANGTLTIKTGTKVYSPNGFESDGTTKKFDVKVLTEDYSYTNSFIGTYNDILVSYQNSDDTFWHDVASSSFCSGETDALAGKKAHDWYDTKNNIIYHYTGTSTEPNGTCSLPILQMENSGSNGFTRVANVFNGFGYMGSTAFALPGVKYQFADGRNSDGTFKSITKTFDKVATTQYGYNVKDPDRQPLSIHESGALIRTARYFIQNSQPVYTDSVWYKPETNETFRSNGSGVWSNSKEIIIATNIATNANFKITSFEPEIASSINIYARSDISGMTMPSGKSIHLTLGSNGTTYLAPANGWFIGNFICSKEGSWFVLEMRAKHTKSFSCAKGNNTEVCAMLPVLEGDSIILGIDSSATFTTDTTRQGFYFIYANGED